MPRFYFDTYDGVRTEHDEAGMVLADEGAARQQAMAALTDLVRDVVPQDGDRRDMTVDVRDADGRVLFNATMSLVARWIR